MAPLTLSLASKSDFPSIAALQYAAFHPHDTMHTLLYPSPITPTPSVLENTVKRLTKASEAEPVTWLKVTDEATGELVAVAKWVIYKDEEPKWPENADAEWINGEIEPDWVRPGGGKWEEDREYVNWVLTEWFGRRKERMRGPLVLLDLCCTNPKYHRQGAGSQLVQWGVDRADELGLKAFVEASLTGRRLYESKGFVVNEEVCLVGGKKRDEWKNRGEIKYCFMEREAKSKGKA